MTSTTSAAMTATLEDDQYNERRHRTIIFSSSWVPQGGMRDLAHLSQVDCQFGSCLKSFQNNNLQFDAGLFSSHLAHFVHAHRRARSESERICRMQSEEMQTARSEGKLIWDWPAPLKSAR